MSETAGRGNGVIIDRPAAGTGTLPRPAPSGHGTRAAQGTRVRDRPDRGEEPRVPRQRATQQRTAQQRTGQQRRVRPGATVAPPRPAPGRTAPQRPAPVPQAPDRSVPARSVPGRAGESRAASSRGPFIVLLCGLLGGALASALVISTTLAEGSFQITRLQQSNSALARTREQLQNKLAHDQSAPVIGQRAYQLGMRPVSQLRFLNLKAGATQTNAGTGAEASISVPGYTP